MASRGRVYIVTNTLIDSKTWPNSCQKHSLEILLHIDVMASHSCWIFICTSIMQISLSVNSQKSSNGLRSGGSGGLWSPLNS